jgi:predicted nucleic acid-binding protein
VLEELEIGVLQLERRDPRSGAGLRLWLDSVVKRSFAGRILPVDEVIAERSAPLHVPDPRPIRDAYLAATALVHGMTVATRNVRDFAQTKVPVFNPWND